MIKIRNLHRSIDGKRGFALIEILIASAVAAVVLGALVAAVTGALRSDRQAEIRQRALFLAQSRLEAAGLAEPLVPGVREGDAAGLHWKQISTRLATDAANSQRQAAEAQTKPGSQLDLFWVELSVDAGDGTRLKLAGLKIAAAK